MKLTAKKLEEKKALLRKFRHESELLKEDIAELVEKRNKIRRKGVALVKKPLKILQDKLLVTEGQIEKLLQEILK